MAILMNSELGALGGHLTVIVAVWLVVIIALQIIKVSMIKSAATALDGEDDADKRTAAQTKCRKSITIASIAATAVAAITVVVFVVFQWNYNAPNDGERPKITPAKIDENASSPSKEDIDAANKNSADVKASEAKKKEATDDNTKAMDDAMKKFREAGNNAKE